jgi:hypothetical protein
MAIQILGLLCGQVLDAHARLLAIDRAISTLQRSDDVARRNAGAIHRRHSPLLRSTAFVGWRAVEMWLKVTSWITGKAGTTIAQGMGERDVSGNPQMLAKTSIKPSQHGIAVWNSAVLFLCGFTGCGPALADPPDQTKPVTVHQICDLIETHAAAHFLPPDFFARLIWKESRFDPAAVSPAGAEGIAQFMPGTAALRGLTDPFDVDQAIPASAAYLSHLKVLYGNFGLAAAAYNAAEQRVSRWLASGGFLPMETESYVLDILGEPADNFAAASYAPAV